jgi:hypothetical protein
LKPRASSSDSIPVATAAASSDLTKSVLAQLPIVDLELLGLAGDARQRAIDPIVD